MKALFWALVSGNSAEQLFVNVVPHLLDHAAQPVYRLFQNYGLASG
jgi:hypothetical protein